MKISELIEVLQKRLELVGDCPVYVSDFYDTGIPDDLYYEIKAIETLYADVTHITINIASCVGPISDEEERKIWGAPPTSMRPSVGKK